MRYNQIKKKTLILKSIPSLFSFCFAVTQAQTLKLDREYKTQNMYWENGISAQYPLKISNQINFLSVLILYHPD
jgi:uncharacterized protein with PQ loop repeat